MYIVQLAGPLTRGPTQGAKKLEVRFRELLRKSSEDISYYWTDYQNQHRTPPLNLSLLISSIHAPKGFKF